MPRRRSLGTAALRNKFHGKDESGVEIVDVIFPRISVFAKNQCPTIPTLCSFVMRAGFPRPSEVKHVEQREPGVFKLSIIRDPCPIRLLPGQSTCPICRTSH